MTAGREISGRRARREAPEAERKLEEAEGGCRQPVGEAHKKDEPMPHPRGSRPAPDMPDRTWLASEIMASETIMNIAIALARALAVADPAAETVIVEAEGRLLPLLAANRPFERLGRPELEGSALDLARNEAMIKVTAALEALAEEMADARQSGS
jgi:hypothetical protein